MFRTFRSRSFALLPIGLLAGACASTEPESSQFAIINIPIVASGVGFKSVPRAFFFEGRGVQLSSTEVSLEGCTIQPLREFVPPPFNFIDAGDTVEIDAGESSALLTHNFGPLGDDIYQPEAGDSLTLTPGGRVSVSIPGAIGGFPSQNFETTVVEAFTPSTVTLTADDAAPLDVTWGPESSLPGTAMIYSFRYAGPEEATLDTEVACIFRDDGSGTVPPEALAGFRASGIRVILAQRALTMMESFGRSVVHVTSTMTVPVALIDNQ